MYISQNYVFDNNDLIRWANLYNGSKKIYLNQACAEIEHLPFPKDYISGSDIPDDFKAAQIELALWLSDTKQTDESNTRAEMQKQGVASFSLGDLSENYASGSSLPRALMCKKCADLLARYLSGSFETC